MTQLNKYIEQIIKERTTSITIETLKILDEVDKISGWLISDEIMLLHNLAKDIDGFVVEIGSWKGKSSVAIASALNEGMLHCIDTFEGSEEHIEHNILELFINNIKKYEDKILYIKGKSKDVVNEFEDNLIDMLFIDGSHEYEDVKNDLNLYFEKVKSDGIILVHDTATNDSKGWEGPTKAVNEFIENNKTKIKEVCEIVSITCFRKV